MRGTLTRLSKGEKAGATRTEGCTGEFDLLPEEGAPFSIIGEPIDPTASVRVFQTSIVKKITGAFFEFVEFETVSGSRYRLDIEPEAKA